MAGFMVPAYNPTPIESPQNALLRGLEMQRAQQGNALQAMQLQALIQQQQEAQRQRAAQQQFVQGLPSPQMAASQNALAGGGGPTVANAQRMPAVDPRLQAQHGAMQAGLISPMDYLKSLYPEQKLQAVGMDQNIVDMNRGGVVVTPGQRKEDAPTGDWKDYQKAKSEGYKGAFIDYQREMANLKAPKTSVNVGAPEREFDKELAKLDAKQLDTYRDSAEKAAGAVARVRAMRGAVAGGVYSGSFAGDRAKLANFFATLGAPGIDLNKLANTQEYQKHAKELVLSVLKEGVGSTNISNADLAFVNDTVPQLETSPEARTRLLNYIEQRSQSNIDKFREADAYARKNRGLGGYATPLPTANPAAPGGPKPTVSNW